MAILWALGLSCARYHWVQDEDNMEYSFRLRHICQKHATACKHKLVVHAGIQ